MNPEPHFIRANPGMHHREGKLYIFAPTKVTVVKVANGPQCWEKRKKSPVFRHVFPPSAVSSHSFRYVLSPPEPGEWIHWTTQVEGDFLARNLDREVLTAIAPYEREHWRMCALAMRAAGLDLVRTNPGLAFIVASNNLFAGHCALPWRRARSMVRWKRIRILERCGFPATQSVVKIMARLDPALLHYPLVADLKRVLAGTDSRARKCLCFLPQLTPIVLRILARPELLARVTGGFLEELAVSDPNPQFGRRHDDPGRLAILQYSDVMRMAREMGVAPAFCRTLADIPRAHDRLVAKYNARQFAQVKREALPPGPIPGLIAPGLVIEHIPDTLALVEWGIRQSNCIASYHGAALAGGIHLYRITAPEEASLSLVRCAGQFVVNQLSGHHNCPVADTTQRLVHAWLRGFADDRATAVFAGEPAPLKFAQVMALAPGAGLDAEFVCTLLDDPDIAFYSLREPEPALVAVRRQPDGWIPMVVRAEHGGEVTEQTHRWIDDWLFNRIPPGTFYQPPLPLWAQPLPLRMN